MEDDIVLRVLGPVEVLAAGARTSSQPPQQRLVLGMLALRAGQPVPVAELIDAVWEDQPPRSARGSLQALVTGVRQVLGPVPGSRLDRCGEAYRLQVEADRVDVHRFRFQAAAGRAAADRRTAVAAFDQALALWRGPALADVPGTPAVAAAASMLAEERLSVIQDRVTALLACGMERQAAADLPRLLAEYPLAERLAGLLIVALYRLGQRDGALRVFRAIRDRLAGELGVEPGPELQALHQRILTGDPDLAGDPGLAPDLAGALDLAGASDLAPSRQLAPARRGAHDGARVVPRQLPAIPPHFAGRTAELKALDELVSRAADGDGRGAVWVLAGPAGVGKTTLAAFWAHRVADRFPDGQLYVSLRGFAPDGRPVAAAEALRGMLRAMGVLLAQIPESLDAQAALYRSMLAGKRMLVLIDNAADAGQVRPLLPGGTGCAVLVTSRSQLTGLVAVEGAHPVFLDVLSEAEACELLVGRLGAQRVMAEPAAATELAGLCAGLPLALSVAAARAAARPSFALAALAAELRSDEGRLDALGTEDADGSVREVLSWSYRQLSGPAARMFRLLGVHQGPEISAPAAASLAGLGVPQARRALAELTSAHLVAESTPGRFGFHDLLRAYARELATEDAAGAECRAAVRRVLDHYLITANAAYPLIYPARDPLVLGKAAPGTTPERVTSRAQARAWFAAEHQVLLAATEKAAAAGYAAHAWQLPAALSEFLDREGHWHDLAVTQRSALAAASRAGDRAGIAHAHLGLAMACLRLRCYDEARAHARRAIEGFRELGDQAREARSRIFLGTACGEQGQHAAARRHTEHALRLYRAIGHQAGQAHALTNLGWHAAALGDYQAALGCCQQALGLHRELGNALGEAHTWDYTGYVRDHLGQHADAVGCYRRALGLLLQVSDRSEQADVLTRLGDAHRALGDRAAARDAWQQALAVLDDLHDPGAAQVESRLDDLRAAR
jgi:DNA-binding SARP family transcriptional activator/tetratricopeptide (TPR) repeat protein